MTWTSFPDNWPRCPVCGFPALDGHITCGSANCNEGEQRRKRADMWRARQPLFHRDPPYTERDIKRSQDNIRRLFREAGIPLADEDYE